MMNRRGVTLAELLVTLVLMGVITSVTTLAVRRIDRPIPGDPNNMLADSLAAAIATSREITFATSINGRAAAATVRADGSVTADSGFHVDPLTGRPFNAR